MSREADLRLELNELLTGLETRRATAATTRWCPQTPTPCQQAFLDLDCDDALYGGAAGGGKSSALLMCALRHVDVPGYAGLIVRKTFRDLALPGAIMDRCAEWLRPTAARWLSQDHTWVFPSGARLTFGVLSDPTSHFRYQGMEISALFADEASQLEEFQYRYIRSRLRRKENFPFAPYSRCASNPGGPGHDWVFERYVVEGAPFDFVPAKIDDNPHLFDGGKEYKAALMDLDEVTRAQLLEGAWVVSSQLLVVNLTKAHMVDQLPLMDGWRYVLGIDLGASVEKPTTAFCICAFHPKLEGVWVTECYKRKAMTVSAIAEEIESLRRRYEGLDRIVVDEGALGRAYGEEFRRRFAIHTEPAQKRDKAGFRKLLRGAIERKLVLVVEPYCADLIAEAKKLRFCEDGINTPKHAVEHAVDSFTYCWRECRSYAARAPVYRHRQGSKGYWKQWHAERLKEERERYAPRTREQDEWW